MPPEQERGGVWAHRIHGNAREGGCNSKPVPDRISQSGVRNRGSVKGAGRRSMTTLRKLPTHSPVRPKIINEKTSILILLVRQKGVYRLVDIKKTSFPEFTASLYSSYFRSPRTACSRIQCPGSTLARPFTQGYSLQRPYQRPERFHSIEIDTEIAVPAHVAGVAFGFD
jgi:hypothetical protein